jgi:thioredoxin 1
MAEWEEKLPPLMRQKLARIGEISSEEKEKIKDSQELDSLLSEFYKGLLDAESLYQVLKEYQDQGKQFLLREAQRKLKDSFKGKRLPIKFEQDEGMLTVELLKQEELEPDLVEELTDNNFDEVMKRCPLLVVDCWAPWCAPCRMVAPVIEELAQDYRGKIAFGKLNVDNNRMVATKYHIMSIPTMLIFKDGELIDQKVGAMPRTVLEPELAKYIEAN